jgi:phosphomannomutase
LKEFPDGSVRPGGNPSYDQELLSRFGKGSLEGVRVALDLGGGAATRHAPSVLRAAGCEVFTLNDTPGDFSRAIDPFKADLSLLGRVVTARGCHLGLAFDCDGDRLVLVDGDGKKRSGDFMLTLALNELLASTEEKRVVVSADTTVAVDELVQRFRGEVFRSKVGEANVMRMMGEKNARLGGEGSSGGLIDGSFNYCRDSLVAAMVIMKSIKAKGEKAFAQVKSYNQTRISLGIPRPRALRAIVQLQRKYKDSDSLDGVKVKLSPRSWALVRVSGTEDLVRISAEAPARSESEKIAASFSRKVSELSR